MSRRVLLPLALLPAVCGCVAETQTGAATTYSFELWAGALVVLGCLALIAGGGLFALKSGWKPLLLAVGGVALLFLVAPMMFTDRVVVDDEHFEMSVGMWFSPTQHNVKFADLRQMDIITETTRGRRGRKNTSYYLVCHKKTGASEKVPVGTLMRPATENSILEKAERAGVKVVDLQPADAK